MPAGMTTDEFLCTMSVTRTEPEPDGLRTVIWSLARTVRCEPGTRPKQTAVTPPRACPVMTTRTSAVPADGEMADTDRWTPPGSVGAFGLVASAPVGTFGPFPDGETEEVCPSGWDDVHAKSPKVSATATSTAGTVRQVGKPPTWLNRYTAPINTTRPDRTSRCQFLPSSRPESKVQAPSSSPPAGGGWTDAAPYLAFTTSHLLAREVDRVATEGIYVTMVFLIRNQRFVQATAARGSISKTLSSSRQLHEQWYRDLALQFVEVPAGRQRPRVALIQQTVEPCDGDHVQLGSHTQNCLSTCGLPCRARRLRAAPNRYSFPPVRNLYRTTTAPLLRNRERMIAR